MSPPQAVMNRDRLNMPLCETHTLATDSTSQFHCLQRSDKRSLPYVPSGKFGRLYLNACASEMKCFLLILFPSACNDGPLPIVDAESDSFDRWKLVPCCQEGTVPVFPGRFTIYD